MGILGKVGNWVGDRWGDGPSMDGLKSSIKGTAKLAGKVAPLAAVAAIPGVGGVVGGALSRIPAVGGLIGGGGADGKGNFGVLGDLGGRAAGAAGARGMGLSDMLQLGVAGYSAYQGAQAAGDAADLQREALEMARNAYDERAPLRQAGVHGLLNPRQQNLSHLFSANQSNPYARAQRQAIPSVGGPVGNPNALASSAGSPMAQKLAAFKAGGTNRLTSSIPSVGGPRPAWGSTPHIPTDGEQPRRRRPLAGPEEAY